MLGRKDYTQDELDHGRAAIEAPLEAYKELAQAVDASGDQRAKAARDAFEPLFLKALALALDRPFVHRIRKVTGHAGTPLNELELLAGALMGDGTFRRGTVIKHVPEESVLGLDEGDQVRLDVPTFERLAGGVFAELEEKFR